ncbi:unnamed protein product [Pleuronectes platessa]|uniref:Uncharacterized protein n=1 Tax=Pleuronectes platessa TaxID=8262 RepID=A0A9N7Y7S3_PLEPL|nr:unnamed protein product [Pleuronectes platessa]
MHRNEQDKHRVRIHRDPPRFTEIRRTSEEETGPTSEEIRSMRVRRGDPGSPGGPGGLTCPESRRTSTDRTADRRPHGPGEGEGARGGGSRSSGLREKTPRSWESANKKPPPPPRWLCALPPPLHVCVRARVQCVYESVFVLRLLVPGARSQ